MTRQVLDDWNYWLDRGYPDAVSASLSFQNTHERFVMLFVFPIPLPFQQRRDGRHSHRTGLHHAGQRSLWRGGRSCAATILHHVNVVARAEHFDRRPGDAHFRLEAGHDDVLPARGFDSLAKFH